MVFGGVFPEFFVGRVGADTKDGASVGVVLVFDRNGDGVYGETHAARDGTHVDFDAGTWADGDGNIVFFFHGVLLNDEAEHGLADGRTVGGEEENFEAGIRK